MRLIGNLITSYGSGNGYWNWVGSAGGGGSFAIRIDRGQVESNPEIRDVLVQGSIVSAPPESGVLAGATVTHPAPRYRYAFFLELPGPVTGHAGARDGSNVPDASGREAAWWLVLAVG